MGWVYPGANPEFKRCSVFIWSTDYSDAIPSDSATPLKRRPVLAMYCPSLQITDSLKPEIISFGADPYPDKECQVEGKGSSEVSDGYLHIEDIQFHKVL